ncbi:hypothetical protein OKW76_07085 [Sphingomonas sp. S1-29]|uniref:hypothetical protein n=1 Tax=Sphingomonas sp. S1-29 TaxID=2991074 RepID=UPI00223EE4D9|nr:hypothetical protein [Sphingomonas sp. S1-29]UZK70779.1 hypothetical protein OKW76_07085 [Sphingomonas sp. S1-29]
MKHDEFQTLLLYLEETADSDPDMLQTLVSMTRRKCPVFYNALLYRDEEIKRELTTTLPRLDQITAAQLTLFDNWRATGGRKPSRKKKEPSARAQRFRAQLELWTTPATVPLTTKSRAVKVTFDLMDADERTEKLAKYQDPKQSKGGFVITNGEPVSQDWSDYAKLIAGLPPETLGGPAYSTTKGNGTTFVLNSLAVIDQAEAEALRDDMRIGILMGHPGESIQFHSFERHYANGTPLPKNAVLSSRLAMPSDHAGWRTGVLSSPEPAPTPEIVREMIDADCPY